jgi:hypothetical protein
MFGVNLRRVTLWLAASFFAWATLIFAAGPIRALRRTGTALSFWTGGFAAVGAFAAFGLWEAAIALGSVVLVAGSFTELGWTIGDGGFGFGAVVQSCATETLASGLVLDLTFV